VFNLVTLFLTSEEIAGLGVLLTMEANEVRTLAENYWGKPPVFCYYVTGSIGAGKTTAVSYLQNLQAYREWVDPPPPLLSKRFTDLTSDQKREVDEWIRGQFAQRNVNLNREHEGIFFIDRSPLDPLAFQQEEERQAAARRMRDAISPGNSGRTICPGHVIMLRGDPRELSARVRERHKTAEPDYVERLQEATKAIYPQRGVTYLDIRDLGLAEVVRRISTIIHFEEYVECDLHARLVELAEELSQ